VEDSNSCPTKAETCTGHAPSMLLPICMLVVSELGEIQEYDMGQQHCQTVNFFIRSANIDSTWILSEVNITNGRKTPI